MRRSMEIPAAFSEVEDNSELPVSLNEWAEFVEKAKEIVQEIKDKEIEVIWGRWKLGKHIQDMKDSRMDRAWYGSQFVEKLAAEIDVHIKTCYQCFAVYKRYPVESDFAEFLEVLKGRGILAWDKVRNKSLPDLSDDFEQVGTEDQQTETILGMTESAMARLQRYVDHGIPERQRDEVEGALERYKEICDDLVEAMDRHGNHKYAPPDPELLKAQGNQNDEGEWTRREYNDFHEWIRSLPCAVCGIEGQTEVAHFPKTKGAGASDLRVIPLCHQHHMDQHTMGIATFWNNWSVQLLDWYGWWVSECFMSIIRRSKIFREGEIADAITEAEIAAIAATGND